LNLLKDIRKIYAGLNPDAIRGAASRNVNVGLVASSDEMYRRMESFLAPSGSDSQALRAINIAGPLVNGEAASRFDFVLCEPGVPVPRNGYVFEAGDSGSLPKLILEENPELEMALARTFPLFRAPASSHIIHSISKENALFSLVTALPNVIPSVLDLPWAVGEFATDTAFLTMNQIRMALQLAAAHDRPVGYNEQKYQLGTILGGAFGWRALARELVGKIPLGGGLIPKAAVAFAGTYVVGLGLEKVNRTGNGMSRSQSRDAYAAAFAYGKKVAGELARSRFGQVKAT
jgi:hypothetical protein